MKLKINFRELNESDINRQCPWIPEKDEFAMYVGAFVEDIMNIEFVRTVNNMDNVLIIELIDAADHAQFKKQISPIIKEFWCKLRVTSIEEYI